MDFGKHTVDRVADFALSTTRKGQVLRSDGRVVVDSKPYPALPVRLDGGYVPQRQHPPYGIKYPICEGWIILALQDDMPFRKEARRFHGKPDRDAL